MGNNNQMNSNGAGEEAPMEANQEMHDEPKDIRGIDLERQGILEEDETKINDSAKYVKDFPKGDIAQPQQPPPLGPIVHWERFLPVRSLNVLLVESDDSTRQLVSALLRNCSYEGKSFGLVLTLAHYSKLSRMIVFENELATSRYPKIELSTHVCTDKALNCNNYCCYIIPALCHSWLGVFACK